MKNSSTVKQHDANDDDGYSGFDRIQTQVCKDIRQPALILEMTLTAKQPQ